MYDILAIEKENKVTKLLQPKVQNLGKHFHGRNSHSLKAQEMN